MKLKELKKLLDKMSKEQLETDLLYISDYRCISGEVLKVKKATANLYYTGEDDPAKLYTRKQLKEDLEMEIEEIEECEIEIPKGALVVYLD